MPGRGVNALYFLPIHPQLIARLTRSFSLSLFSFVCVCVLDGVPTVMTCRALSTQRWTVRSATATCRASTTSSSAWWRRATRSSCRKVSKQHFPGPGGCSKLNLQTPSVRGIHPPGLPEVAQSFRPLLGHKSTRDPTLVSCEKTGTLTANPVVSFFDLL